MTTLRWPGPLVPVSWLATQLGDPELVLLDATFHPVTAAVPSETSGLRLPGARVLHAGGAAGDLRGQGPGPGAAGLQLRFRGNGLHTRAGGDTGGVFSAARVRWFLE
jgi:3-mercaptopyruvate sulfurtransferase SseA